MTTNDFLKGQNVRIAILKKNTPAREVYVLPDEIGERQNAGLIKCIKVACAHSSFGNIFFWMSKDDLLDHPTGTLQDINKFNSISIKA
jgi:hypothetical protein